MQTITKVYENYEHAQHAITELEANGIPAANISLVANEKYAPLSDTTDTTSEAGAGAGLGAAVGGAAGLLAGVGLMAIPGLGPVVAAGWFASTALGLVAGGAAGGIVGSLIDAGVPEDHAHVYSEAVKRGGILVSVRVAEAELANAQRILGTYQPIDPVAQGETYRRTGWSKFDDDEAAENSATTETQRKRLAS